MDKTRFRNKCDEILSHIEDLLEAFPGYTLYVTGHSLGGALASLFSFSAACCDLPHIKRQHPIRCIGIASPKVGNEDFRAAFELLEEQNKIRYLRIVNDKDLIPMMPEQHLPLTKPLLRKQVYRHVGIELKLYNHSKGVRLSYRRLKDGLALASQDLVLTTGKYVFALSMCAIGCCVAKREHSCHEYGERICKRSKILEKLKLPLLYDLRLKNIDQEILFNARNE